jgi:tripartite-type tricarboxylate transporter receptor subunit TctC
VLKFTMTVPRRKFLRVAVVVAALPALPPIASALDCPTRTVRVIAPFWDGVFVPTGTPLEIVKLLGDEIRKIVALPDIASRIEALGFSPVAAPSNVFAKQLASESATWSEVIRAAGLKMR